MLVSLTLDGSLLPMFPYNTRAMGRFWLFCILGSSLGSSLGCFLREFYVVVQYYMQFSCSLRFSCELLGL